MQKRMKRKTFPTKIDIKLRKTKPTTDERRALGWRLWLFRVISLIFVPALLFLLLEAGLHIIGYGFSPNAIVKCKVDGRAYYRDNLEFAWRFFPPNIARTANPFVFPAAKSNDTYRIFVLGESAAAGTPDGAFCFGRILQVMLRQQYPQANFEVITTAMPAINSHVIFQIAKDCVRHKPDLFIAYIGNNEVVGPYGAGTIFAPLSKSPSFIRFDIALKATRVGQLLTNLMEKVRPKENIPKVWRGLEMFIKEQIRADDPRLETVYQHFQRNLEDISHVARKSETRIIFCTVGSNLKDCPPFASLHRPDLKDAEKKKWDDIYRQGIVSESAGDYAGAAQRYLAAGDIDDRYAELQFRLGRCYWAMGEYDQARQRFTLARDLDTLRFRADTRINQIIRDIAEGETTPVSSVENRNGGVYFVDAVKVFQENSPYKTAGEELFYEHVHMNFKGNSLLAGAIFKQVEEMLPERIKRYKAEQSPTLSEAECARYLAYTDWDRYKIADQILNTYVKRPPFTNQLYHSERVNRMEQNLKSLKTFLTAEVLNEVEAQYHWAIQQSPSDLWVHWKYGLLLEELEKYEDSALQYRLVLNFVPHHYEAYAKLGFLFGKQGDLDAAIDHSLKAVRIYPICAEAYFNLGFAYQLRSKLDKAVEYYSKSIRIMPNFTPSYNNLGLVLYMKGKVKEAVETYRNGLIYVPENLNLHYNLGVLLEKQGQIDGAIKELRTALHIDPNSVKVRNFLDAILKKSSQTPQ
jgi:tetratricopeptide (TPR) repeat protein